MIGSAVARSKSPFQIRLEYYPLRGLLTILHGLPEAWSRRFFEAILRAVLFFMPKRRALVQANLAASFPGLNARQRQTIADQSIGNFARGLSVFIHIPRLCRKGMDERVDNPEHFGAMYTEQPAEFAAQNTAVSIAGMAIPGRSGPETVAPMVAFFASEEAWYITGQIISVGGGRWMG